jgi:hypothetical protein
MTVDDLKIARQNGTLLRWLKEMVERSKHDTYARELLARCSPHLTTEEKVYCRQVDQETEWL